MKNKVKDVALLTGIILWVIIWNIIRIHYFDDPYRDYPRDIRQQIMME